MNTALPIVFVLTAWCLAFAYEAAPRSIAEVLLPIFGGALLFAPTLLYPTLRLRGATARWSAIASLTLLATWLAKECYQVARVFTPGEGAYYALNPLMHGIYSLIATQLAVWELVVRRKRGKSPILSGWPVYTLGAIATFWSAVAFANRNNDATAIHYAYIELYRRLFTN